MSRSRTDPLAALTPREREVARLYADGEGRKEVARRLGIAPGTVRSHLDAVFRKLEVRSRLELHRLLADSAPPRRSEDERCDRERRQLTVLFVDLVGSTELASRIDAEELHELLLAYRAVVGAEIERFGGHVAGFQGDGIIACFGWPRAFEDMAERGVRAALAAVRATARISVPQGGTLAARVGVATGEVVIDARTGSSETLVGDTPHLAARLQAEAGPGEVVIADSTHRLVRGLFETVSLGRRFLRGFGAPVVLHRVAGEAVHTSRYAARHPTGGGVVQGREAERSFLRHRWQRTLAGHGCAVLLLGEPGIGKSCLATEAAARAEAEGYPVVRCQTSSHRRDSPLWPVLTWLESAITALRQRGDEEERLLLDVFLARAGIRDPEGAAALAALAGWSSGRDVPASGARLREAALGVLLRLWRENGPRLLLIEDLHWADASTLELVGRLLDDIGRVPVMLLVTSREAPAGELGHRLELARMGLDRLDRETATALVRSCPGADALSPSTVEAVVARGDGVPLHLEEITAAMVAGHGDAQAVPTSLRDSLAARLDSVPEAREIAQMASVLGRSFTREPLIALVGDRAATERAVARLVEMGLLLPRGDGYIFKHALVQEAAYASLLRRRRTELHARVAELFLGVPPGTPQTAPELLAHHLERAGRTEAAIHYHAAAAEAASDRGANREATRHIERALRLADELPAAEGRTALQLRLLTVLGRVTVALYGHASDRMAEVYRRALAKSGDSRSAAARLPVLLALTVHATVGGDQDAARGYARRLEGLAAETADAVTQVAAHYGMGITHAWRGELPAALEHFEAALGLYAIDQHARHVAMFGQDAGVVCGCRAATVLLQMGRVARARSLLTQAVELAEDLAHPFSVSYVLNWQALYALECEDLAEAERVVHRSLDYAREQHFSTFAAMSGVLLGHLHLLRGEPEAARRMLADASRALDATGTRCFRPYADTLIASALAELGELEGARARAEDAHLFARRSGTRWVEAETHRRLAAIERKAGAAPAAVYAHLDRARAVAERQGATLAALRALTDLAHPDLRADRAGLADRLCRTIDRIDPRPGLSAVTRARAALRELQSARA